jgi:tetratricopeptide (TPR) repeat protein
VIYAEKAISLSPHPRNYFQLANAYWGQGDDVSCLKVLRKMLEVDPMDFYEAHRAMAVVYREQGKKKQAAKVESRLEALRDHRKSLNSEPALVRDGEFRYSLFNINRFLLRLFGFRKIS